jgi:hypothetical protein
MRKYFKIFRDGESISMKICQPSQGKLSRVALFFSFCKRQHHHHVIRRKHPCIRIELKPAVNDMDPTASIICEYFGEYGELG